MSPGEWKDLKIRFWMDSLRFQNKEKATNEIDAINIVKLRPGAVYTSYFNWMLFRLALSHPWSLIS